MDAITVTIPLPPQAMYPNARKHWKAKMKPKAEQRRDAKLASLDAIRQRGRNPCGPMWKLAECQATFYLERRRDGDNLIAWLKATFDGLEDAGIVENDGNFIHLPPKQVTGKHANGERKVVLTITPRATE
jgi:Holliday junction resolvase RusA-like endonuclease